MKNRTERFLIPAEGLRVIDPATGKPLPPGGGTVRGNEIHWLRRAADGDVVEGAAAATSTKPRLRKVNEAAKGSQE